MCLLLVVAHLFIPYVEAVLCLQHSHHLFSESSPFLHGLLERRDQDLPALFKILALYGYIQTHNGVLFYFFFFSVLFLVISFVCFVYWLSVEVKEMGMLALRYSKSKYN